MDALSKNESLKFTPSGLRALTKQRPARTATPSETGYRVHGIADRLGKKKVDRILKRYRAGESARSLAREYDVAPSALVRLLRESSVVMRRKVISSETKALLVKGYEEGATIAELEDRHHLSHGSVLRALHKAGVQMRAKTPNNIAGLSRI